jgi:hypothetical protein
VLSLSDTLCRVEHLKVDIMTGRTMGMNFMSCRMLRDQDQKVRGMFGEIEGMVLVKGSVDECVNACELSYLSL